MVQRRRTLSGFTDSTLLQQYHCQADTTENLEKVLNFAPGESNGPFDIFMDGDFPNNWLSQQFSVVKPDLITRTEK